MNEYRMIGGKQYRVSVESAEAVISPDRPRLAVYIIKDGVSRELYKGASDQQSEAELWKEGWAIAADHSTKNP